jgi:hypothetical protein
MLEEKLFQLKLPAAANALKEQRSSTFEELSFEDKFNAFA